MRAFRVVTAFCAAVVGFQGCLLPDIEVDPNFNQGGSSSGSTAKGGSAGNAGNAGRQNNGGSQPSGGGSGGGAGAPDSSGGTGPITNGGTDSSGGTDPGLGGGPIEMQGAAPGVEPTPDPVCGDGEFVSDTEDCDDGNAKDGDGCDATCKIETGYACTAAAEGEASKCSPICGDSMRVGNETDATHCDDSNRTAGDGCAEDCTVETGFTCTGTPTVCKATCGDGTVVGAEAQAGGCDDGDKDANDGCSATCTVEVGYVCTGAPSTCAKTCGNGTLETGEKCDDGNTTAGDGCAACAVEPGFTCTGTATCTDINECADAAKNDCDTNATCTNTKGSFTCACKSGYSGNGVTCQNINECTSTTTPDNCNANASCTDTAGGFTCACNAGYSGNGVTCSDINECTAGGSNCSTNANCTNTTGSFTCACKSGYSGNGVNCNDVNECTSGGHNCNANANCTNTGGAFSCACKSGFTGNGVTCTDINECSQSPSPCTNTAEECTNTPGGYTCACPSGTRLNAGKCMTILQLISNFTPVDISSDGTVVAGRSGDFPARWSQADSTVRTLSTVSGSSATKISGDGHTIIGWLNGTAARWVDLGAGQVLLNNSSLYLTPQAVNKDGSVIIGLRSSDNFLFRWRNGTITYTNPATASPDISNQIHPHALSDDGNIVGGEFGDPFYDQGFRWNLSTSAASVWSTSDPYSAVQPRDMSADGTTIVGGLWGANGMLAQSAFFWKSGTLTKMTSVVDLDGAIATNSNGTRAIGQTTYWSNMNQRSVDLLSYAASVGGDIGIISTILATNMSDDGKSIIGTVTTTQGVTRGFILRIP